MIVSGWHFAGAMGAVPEVLGFKLAIYSFQQIGQCWQVKGAMRGFVLLTVPPYLARSPAELLVPAEVLTNKQGSRSKPGRQLIKLEADPGHSRPPE